jgi:hypothetical protein
MAAGRYGPQVFHANGTSTQPIYLFAAGRVVLSRPAPASDAAQMTPLLRVDQSSHVHVVGLTLIGMKGRRDYNPHDTTSLFGELDISDYVTSAGGGIVVQGVTVLHSNFTCIKQEDDEQYETFLRNRVRDCGAPGDTLEHGIYLSGGHNRLLYNTIEKVTGFGIHCYQTSNVTVDYETIRWNFVRGAGNTGILAAGEHERVKNNVVVNSPFGIQVWGGDSLIARNVIIRPTYAMSLKDLAGSHRPITVANNTVYRSGSPIIGYGGSIVPVVHMLNNIFDSPNNDVLNWTPARGSVIDYNDYVNVAPPLRRGRHSIYRDPMFMRPGIDFRLRSGSPARGAGTMVRGVVGRRPTNMGAE